MNALQLHTVHIKRELALKTRDIVAQTSLAAKQLCRDSDAQEV